MTKLLGNALDTRMLNYLRGGASSRNKVILLLTSSHDGWPHVAMLSSTEVFAYDTTNVRIATYISSTTTKNLLNNGISTILLIDKGMACYIEGVARLLKRHAESDKNNSIFNIRLKKVLQDHMAGTRITSGITFWKARNAEIHDALFTELRNT